MDYPILFKLNPKVDHFYRTEENRIKNFAVGTMAQMVCKIEVGTKKKTNDVYENIEINADHY